MPILLDKAFGQDMIGTACATFVQHNVLYNRFDKKRQNYFN